MSGPVLAAAHQQAVSSVLARLSEMGVTINAETGAISLSDDLISTIAPKAEPNGHDPYDGGTVTFSGDLAAFRDPPRPTPAAAPARPAPQYDEDLDRPVTRRELSDLVRQLQGGQSPAPYRPGPAPSAPTFRSEAVLNVLEAQIRDAWRRRGRA